MLHYLTHRHRGAEHVGVGTYIICELRLPGWPYCRVWFRPDLDGADWHRVPAGPATGTFSSMLRSSTPHEAMAALRKGLVRLA